MEDGALDLMQFDSASTNQGFGEVNEESESIFDTQVPAEVAVATVREESFVPAVAGTTLGGTVTRSMRSMNPLQRLEIHTAGDDGQDRMSDASDSEFGSGERDERDNEDYGPTGEVDIEGNSDDIEINSTGHGVGGPEIDDSPRLDLDHEDFSYYEVKSGIDSINLISTNFNNFFDTLAMKESVWKFSNTLRRTSVDTGSRYKVRYLGDLNAPNMAGGIKVKNVPVHLFPNMRLAEIDIKPGVTMTLSLHLIYPDMVKKANYFNKLNFTLVNCAFNFARKKWLEIPAIAELIRREKDKLDIQRRLQPLHQFRGQMGSTKQHSHLKSVNHQIPSAYGRLFMRSVFEALKFFFTNYDDAERMARETGEDLRSHYFHGVEGSRPTKEEFISAAKDIWNTGLLVAKCAGCKNAFEGNPEVTIKKSSSAIRKKKRTNKFMRAAFAYHRQQMADFFLYKDEFDNDDDYIFRRDRDSDVTVEADSDVEADIPVTFHSKDGDLQFKRVLGGVTMTYDVGFNIQVDNVNVSCIPKGAHVCYFLSTILGQNRLYDVAAEWMNDPKSCFMYKRLLGLKDNEFFMDIVDLFLSMIESEDDAGLREQDFGVGSTLEDWDMALLDMCQDELVRESGEDPDVFLNVVDVLEEIRSREMFSYPICGTDGVYSNVHSGKAILLVHLLDGTDKLTVRLDESETHGSCIFGGQIYDPNALKLSLKKILDYDPGISRFAHAMKSALFDGDSSAFLTDRLKNMQDILKTIGWFDDFQKKRIGELSYSKNGAPRYEFFLQLKDEDPFNEKWEKVPNILKTIQCVNSEAKARYEYALVEECLQPLLRFKEMSEPSVRQNAMPNFVTIPTSHKIAYVMNAELLLLRINFFPFQRYFFKFMEIENQTTRANGNWVIPFACRTSLPGDVETDEEVEANRLTGLEFGIDATKLGTTTFRPVTDICGEFYSRVNSDQTLHYQADRMKKRMRCSYHYVKVMQELKGIMLAFMGVDEARSVTVDHFEIEYGVFDKVDYGKLARIRDDQKVVMMMDQICLKVLTMYQASWYNALRSNQARKIYLRPGDVHPGVIEEHWSLRGVPRNTGDINVCVAASLHTDNPLRFDVAPGFVETPCKYLYEVIVLQVYYCFGGDI